VSAAPGSFCVSTSGASQSSLALASVSRRIIAVLLSAIATVTGLLAAGCHPHVTTPVERGAVIYRTNCIACHNANPNLPGSLGPAIAGAPRDLIATRVLHGAYPAGYLPKRHTHIMKPLPWLEPHIEDLAAFLAAAKADRN
jgi:mono/diheme cytochrome c family protein